MGPQPLAKLRSKRVVALPDVFIDAVAHLPRWDNVSAQMRRIVRDGGGNLPIGPVEFKLGGNAANVAFALARLGAESHLITETDALGLHLLERARAESGLRLEHVRVGRAASATLALEFGTANLMLSHAGPLRSFGPDRLRPKDWRLLDSADAVLLVNWAQNREGTALLRALAPRLHRNGAFLYVDTSDPRHRGPAARNLVRDSRLWHHVGAWGLNENELRAFTGDPTAPLERLAGALSERLGTTVDLHTRTWAASFSGRRAARVEAPRTPAKRLTGAGDAWNAGNLAGYLLEWSPRDRLRLAHRVATSYVTSASGMPPRPRDL